MRSGVLHLRCAAIGFSVVVRLSGAQPLATPQFPTLIRIPRPSELARFDTQAHTPLARLRACIPAPTSIAIAHMNMVDRGRATNDIRKSDEGNGGVVQHGERDVAEKQQLDASEGAFPRSRARVQVRAAGNSECFAAEDAEPNVRRGDKEDGFALRHIALACARPPSPALSAHTEQRLRAYEQRASRGTSARMGGKGEDTNRTQVKVVGHEMPSGKEDTEQRNGGVDALAGTGQDLAEMEEC
ncbi:hypothetical protein B0H17DRAFT_1196898 [Mycena rosella]|uniref:Uncharacterized protein n=1 Tax=Mycena rosella TaxID=1033263 RepID=A0AAD7GJS0_MYCRO|nr:hypothetical protein B0H17DRAFT_1196898 [Mycena rosella]